MSEHICLGVEELGITIEYIKDKKRLDVIGFYGGNKASKGDSISLTEFCKRLGITRNDLPE